MKDVTPQTALQAQILELLDAFKPISVVAPAAEPSSSDVERRADWVRNVHKKDALRVDFGARKRQHARSATVEVEQPAIAANQARNLRIGHQKEKLSSFNTLLDTGKDCPKF